jgi:hypothetical protein
LSSEESLGFSEVNDGDGTSGYKGGRRRGGGSVMGLGLVIGGNVAMGGVGVGVVGVDGSCIGGGSTGGEVIGGESTGEVIGGGVVAVLDESEMDGGVLYMGGGGGIVVVEFGIFCEGGGGEVVDAPELDEISDVLW